MSTCQPPRDRHPSARLFASVYVECQRAEPNPRVSRGRSPCTDPTRPAVYRSLSTRHVPPRRVRPLSTRHVPPRRVPFPLHQTCTAPPCTVSLHQTCPLSTVYRPLPSSHVPCTSRPAWHRPRAATFTVFCRWSTGWIPSPSYHPCTTPRRPPVYCSSPTSNALHCTNPHVPSPPRR